MTPLWGHSAVVADFVAHLTYGRGFGPCEAMGVIDRNGRLVGGLVFHNYMPEHGTVEISGASIERNGWLTRAVLIEAARYVFSRMGCQMAYFRVDPEARHIRRICRVLGGVEHEIPRMRGRDRPEILIVVTEEAWTASKFMEARDAARKRTQPDADGHGRRAPGAGRAWAEAEPVSAHAGAAAGAGPAAAGGYAAGTTGGPAADR